MLAPPVLARKLLCSAAVVLLVTEGNGSTHSAPQADGIIAGTLTTADLGRPVRRAIVKIVSVQPARTITTSTDADGRFRFAGLPPGDYTLSAAKQGFLETVFGARRPGAGVVGTPLHLAAGQRIDDLVMRLPRGGVISGIVTDEFGDAAMGVPVRAMRLGYDNGARVAQPAAIATTDDLGGYRLAGLLPGEYVVSAVPRDTVAGLAASEESLRLRMSQIAASGRPPPATIQAARPPDPTGYVPVYFSGAVSPSAATRIAVGASQQVGGIDLQLQSVKTATIAGTISNADGTPASANVQLVDPAMPIANLGVWFRNATPGGKFSFAGLAPATYVVSAQASARGGGGLLSGSVSVSVEGEAVSVVVTLNTGVTIAGSIDAASFGPPVRVQRLRVQLDPIATASDWEMSRYEDAPEPDGTFTIRGVPTGRYRVSVAGLPAGWALDTATFGDRNAADVHLLVERGENLGAGLLKLTSKTSEVAGTVATAAGEPAPDRTVVLFPADRSLRVPQSRRIHVVQPAPDGRYSVRGLPAGHYRLAVVDGVEAGQQFDPGFLAQVEGEAVAAAVTAGARATIDLRVR